VPIFVGLLEAPTHAMDLGCMICQSGLSVLNEVSSCSFSDSGQFETADGQGTAPLEGEERKRGQDFRMRGSWKKDQGPLKGERVWLLTAF